jgi:predicted GTPase
MKVDVQKLIERCIEKMDCAIVYCRNSHIKYVFEELDRKKRIWIQTKALKVLLKSYEEYMKNNYWVDDIDDFINKLEEDE